jgi:hypothetical protein
MAFHDLMIGVGLGALLMGCGSDVRLSGGGGAGAGGAGGGADACPPPPCEIGACTPEPLGDAVPFDEQAVTGVVGPVVTNAYAYWCYWEPFSSWQLYRVPICGGAVELVDQGAGYVRGMSADADAAYIGVRPDPDNGFEPRPHITRYPDAGEPSLAVDSADVHQLFVTAEALYWTGSLGSVSPLGAHHAPLAPPIYPGGFVDPDTWSGIRSDDLHIYWGGQGGVRRGTVGDPEDVFEVVMPLVLTADIALVGDDWLIGYEVEGADGQQEVHASQRDGGGQHILLSGRLHSYFATDAGHAYVRTFDDLETPVDVHRLGPDDGSDDVVLSVPLNGDLDVAGGWLYAFSILDGVIRVPLPP